MDLILPQKPLGAMDRLAGGKRERGPLEQEAFREKMIHHLLRERGRRCGHFSPLMLASLLPLLLFLMAAACSAPAASSGLVVVLAPTPAPATPRPVLLPADEAPHEDLSEWWYYTGHLKSESGKQYGFELVVFQAVRGENPVGYAAHFAITDHQRESFSFDQKTDKALRIQGDGRYRLEVGGWQMGGEGDDHFLRAHNGRYGLDLRLHSTKPPALHGGSGWISFGPVGDSYYYSRTHMEVEGTLQDGAETERVSGLAWMDHQWGNFILVNGGGWDWFSLQLSDGTEVMVTVLRDQPGSVPATYGSHVDREGRVTDLKAEDIGLEVTDRWRSPHSGAVYPSGWELELPHQDLELHIEPVLADQELNTINSAGVIYWEGEVRASGSRNGIPLFGEGYVELTGYAR